MKLPVIDIREYLNGEIDVWGTLLDRKGRAQRYFTAILEGSWEGNEGTLTEHFSFDDGKTQTRKWSIAMQDDNNFTATAADVHGTATGVQQGNQLQMHYLLEVPFKGKRVRIAMDDRLHLIDEKRLINTTVMKKWGITVGRLAIAFEKK